ICASSMLLCSESPHKSRVCSQTWTLFKEAAPRFKHPFSTTIVSTSYCYNEPLTTQLDMNRIKGFLITGYIIDPLLLCILR
ncbi:MAG: hypothetical protein ACKPKO_44630, partial [Candidatus Fonsibacter sp.]